MGYYTRYRLSYKLPEEGEGSSETERFIQECKNKNIEVPDHMQIDISNISLEAKLEKVLNGETITDYSLMAFVRDEADSCKWYEHTKDMIKLSKLFPDILFTLHGEGEEAGDMWYKYYLNGKVQIAEAKTTFDEFDPEKLN